MRLIVKLQSAWRRDDALVEELPFGHQSARKSHPTPATAGLWQQVIEAIRARFADRIFEAIITHKH
jgi:hypothetical protein